MADQDQTLQAVNTIKAELEERLEELRSENKLLEAQRLEQRTYDLEMLLRWGTVMGLSYSRHMDGRAPGEQPYTLIDFFPDIS